ncbi:MAG TPA: efflux RND transporter permease subunit [Planctomycetota bacterium]|nr:efflux RND transporter permease subunit [Planctomycetota bacterium]
MLKSLVEFSIRFRGVVIALACVVLGYGLTTAVRAKFDVFPEFAPPLVTIVTEAPGLSPEEVESLVTRPIENAVNGVGGLESLRSQSIQGLSVVSATFLDGTDIYRARQMVSERLVEAEVPQGVRPPTMAPLTSSASVVLTLGLTSDKRTARELRTFADWALRPRLLGVPGVAKVVVFGGEVRQLEVQVLPDRLLAHDLSLDDVRAAAAHASGVRGAGFIDTEAQRITLQTRGQALTPEELGEVVVAHRDGASLRLKDVARVVEGHEPIVGGASILGKPGILLQLSSQYGANTMEVTRAVEAALDEMQPTIQAEEIALYPRLFRPANFIETAISNVNFSLLTGGFLVAVVLFLFLFDLRTAFISITAIPLSLLGAVIALDRLGLTLNTLTLGGLAIAIGEVVDDAIIDVENILRRLRENRALSTPRTVFEVVLDASLEVRSAVVYATFVVALVFLPVLTMSGIQGKLFAPLGLAYIFAILSSLVVALTLTPALSFVLLRSPRGHRETRFVAALKTRYRRALDAATARPKSVLFAVTLLCLAALATLPFFGGAFLPELQEGHLILHMSAVPGTSLAESLRLGHEVTKELLRNPHIESVSQQVGRAELADDVWGTNYSEFNLGLKPLSGEEAESVQAEIREALVKFPGVYFAINSFLTERIEETMTGVTAQVVVKIFGDDLEILDRKAREVAAVISSIRGAADVQVQSPPGAPREVVRLRPERLQRYGMDPVQVLDAVQTAYQGTVVGQTYQGNRVSDITVVLDEAMRRDPENVGALLLRSSAGINVPLRELADVEQVNGRYGILHDGTRRRQAVTCNVRGRDVATFVADAKRRVAAEVLFPTGTYAAFTGASEAQAQARREILTYSLVAAVGIVLLLSIVFRRPRNLLLVLANLPFALVGGVLAVFFTGGWLSVGALVGFVTLFGISTRNSIMMVSHYEHLVDVEGVAWGREAAIRGATERLLPILMTALVTALGLLPLAIGSGEPGREIEGPMAIVILGGLLSSTALNLLVLPALTLRYGRFDKVDGLTSSTTTPRA